MNTLKKLNRGVSPRRIKPGQKLVVSRSKAIKQAESSASSVSRTYKVKYGDTLWHIARKFNTTVRRVMRDNNLATSSLKPGKVLYINR